MNNIDECPICHGTGIRPGKLAVHGFPCEHCGGKSMNNIDDVAAAHHSYCRSVAGMGWTRLAEGEYEAIIAAAQPQAIEALRELANDTTHDGRWAAGRAEAALVAMGVDPRIPEGQ